MAERVLVKILAGEMYAWIRLADGAGMETGPATALAEAITAHEVIAVIPAIDTLLTRAEVPSNAKAVITKAVPFAIEDQLADEPEALVFAHAAAGEPLMRDIAVASAAVVNGIVEAIEGAGGNVVAAVPETTLLPFTDSAWSILLRDDVAVVRTGERSGFAIESVALDALLQIEPETLPDNVCIYATPANSVALNMLSKAQLRYVNVTDALTPLVAAPRCGNALDFLRDRWPAGHAKWLRFLIAGMPFMLIMLVAFWGLGIFELRQVETRIQAERAEQMRTFRGAFPDVHRVVNVRVQAEQKLASLRGSRGAGLEFLDAIYMAGLHASTEGDDIEFRSFSYGEGVFNVQVRSRSANAIEAYRNRLVTENLSAELISAENTSEHVIGRLRVAQRKP